MTDESLQGRDRIVATYLEQLQDLASEITAASEAVSANHLQAFRDSVHKQEMLCEGLASMAGAVGDYLRLPSHAETSGKDQPLDARIRSACLELQKLNHRYESLLKHSGRSIALLSLLFQSKSGQIHPAFQPKRQTWSCEV